MSKNYTQDGIGQSTEFGRAGNRVASNPTAPGGGTRVELRENDDTTPSRTSGAQALQPDEYITLAQFQSQSKWIAPVRLVANTEIAALTGTTATIDGQSVVAGDRVALTAQATAGNGPIDNGVWIVQAGAWTRPADFAAGDSASNRTFLVGEGTQFADTTWTVSTDPPADVIDVDNLTLVQTTGQGQTAIENIGTGTGLLVAGPQAGPAVKLSAIAPGLGVQLAGGGGVGALTVDSPVTGNPIVVPGAAALVLSNAADAATRLRDLVSVDSSVTIGIDANGNIDLSANPTALPNYTSTVFVDPAGLSTSSGLNPAEPTDYATAVAYANANPGTLLVLADGTYADGDGPATGTTTITGRGTGIVARNGPGSVDLTDGFTVSTTAIVFVDLLFSGFPIGVTFGATVDAPGRTVIQNCTFDPAGLTFAARLDQEIDLIDCEISSLLISGASAPSIRVFGGELGSLVTSFNSEQPRTFNAIGVDQIGPVSFGHSGSANYTYRVVAAQNQGQISDSLSSRTNVELDSIAVCAAITLSSGAGGRLIMRDVACVNENTRAPLSIVVGDNYTGRVLLHNVIFDRATSQLGSTVNREVTAVNQSEANQNGADFSVAKIQTTQNDAAPRVLVQDPAFDNLVQWRDPATLGATYTAGRGINPTQLGSNIIQTADPIEATQTPGVPLVLYRPLSSQGNGTVVVGTVPAGARILRTTLHVASSTNSGASGANADVGYNGGTGVELQNGATDNSVLSPDTYVTDDLVQTTAPQQIDAVFSSFDGVINGNVVVEYFLGA
jgi:hypothetical protein